MSNSNDNRTIAATSVNAFLLIAGAAYQFNKNKELVERINGLEEAAGKTTTALEKARIDMKLRDETIERIRQEIQSLKQEPSSNYKHRELREREEERYHYPNSYQNSFKDEELRNYSRNDVLSKERALRETKEREELSLREERALREIREREEWNLRESKLKNERAETTFHRNHVIEVSRGNLQNEEFEDLSNLLD